jgi:flagellar P-ring protein FlgI
MEKASSAMPFAALIICIASCSVCFLFDMKRFAAFLFIAAAAHAEIARLKDLVSLEGERDNQLMGYGIVAGLARTGDSQMTIFSTQSLSNLLKRMGVTVDPTQIQVHDMAAVMVSATLPPFAQPGSKLDVTVSAIGDASSLRGGILLLTPLKAGDGQVYAVAQGPVVTGAFIAGRPGNSEAVNHPTTGRTPEGGIVERAPPSVAPGNHFNLQLREADFGNAAKIVDLLNVHFANSVAHAESPGVITVDVPAMYPAGPVAFIAELENLQIEAEHKSKIVINERTGTIVAGKDVEISPVSIMHGNLTIEVRTQMEVSQPGPMSDGKTTVVPQVDVKAKEEKAKNVVLDKGATIEELVRALIAIGSTPRDIIAVLENLSSAGALNAELEVI